MRCVSVRGAWVLFVGLLLLVMATGAASADHDQGHFLRSYEGSHTVAWGAPGQGGAFIGTALCNQQSDGPSTGACVGYGTGPVPDYSGHDFEVRLTDTVFGGSTAFLVGFDMTGDSAIDCTGQDGGPDVCYFGSGTVEGVVPEDAALKTLWVFPITMHQSSSPLCCPQSFATTGSIEITFED